MSVHVGPDDAAWSMIADAADLALTLPGLSRDGLRLIAEAAASCRCAAGLPHTQAQPVGRSQLGQTHLVCINGGAGRNEDALAWEKLAAAAEECLTLDLSHDAFRALVRIETVVRQVAGLPAVSRRQLRAQA